MADVVVNIVGDADSLKRALGDSESSLSAFASKAQAVGERATSIGRSMTFGVTLPLIGLGKVAFDELEASAKASAQTEAAIRSTGGAAHVTARQVDELATALLKKTGIDDEAVKSGQNMLLTFTNIRNETGRGNDIFNQATKAALDMSVAFGKDVTSSALTLGKALNDPIGGVTALRRVGVQLSDQQEQQIKDFVAVGDVMSAQKVILSELTREVGGSAEAYGNSLAGQVSKAKEELANSGAQIMSAVAPALSTLARFASDAAKAFASLPAPLQALALAGAGVVAAVGPIVYVFGAVSKAVSGTISFFQAAASASETLALKSMYAVQALGGMGSALGLLGGALAVAGIAIAAANGAFDGHVRSIQEVISAVNEMTNVELANYIQKMELVGQKLFGQSILHGQFIQIMQQNTATAMRYIEVLQSQGVNTDWYVAKLQNYLARQKDANAANDEAKAKIEALKNSVNSMPPYRAIRLDVDAGDAIWSVDTLQRKLNELVGTKYWTSVGVTADFTNPFVLP